MDNKKFEQLIDLIINENEEKARELFHDIIVEKSREIYENIMMDEMMGDEECDEGMGGQVGDMLDEISAEEAGGMTEADEDMEDLDDDGDEIVDIDSDEMGDETEDEEGLEDAVVRIEDKLDQLMAEFEDIMGKEEGDEEDFGDEEEMGSEEDFGDEEEMGDEEEEEETLEEAIQLKKVSVTHGDNGSNPKSTVAANAGARGMASKPVKFSGDSEAVPTSPKGPSTMYNKGEGQVKHAGQWKNTPAQGGQDLESAPKPHLSQATGVNTKSVMGESRKRSSKKIVK